MRLKERVKRLEQVAKLAASPVCSWCGRPHLWAAESPDFCLCGCCRPLWEREAPALMEEIGQIVAGT